MAEFGDLGSLGKVKSVAKGYNTKVAKRKKKYLSIFISVISIYLISWAILGKSKLFDREFDFIRHQQYYSNDNQTIYLITFDYNYFEGYGFFDSLYVSNHTITKVDTRMIDKNSANPFVHFRVPWYNPFFIESKSSYWILGTDGVFDYSTIYVWLFIDWLKISNTSL